MRTADRQRPRHDESSRERSADRDAAVRSAVEGRAPYRSWLDRRIDDGDDA